MAARSSSSEFSVVAPVTCDTSCSVREYRREACRAGRYENRDAGRCEAWERGLRDATEEGRFVEALDGGRKDALEGGRGEARLDGGLEKPALDGGLKLLVDGRDDPDDEGRAPDVSTDSGLAFAIRGSAMMVGVNRRSTVTRLLRVKRKSRARV